MIFLEASHTLHFRSDKTDVQLCVFRQRAFAEFFPIGLNGSWVEFEEFTEGQVKMIHLPFSTRLNLAKYLIENGLNNLQLAHVRLFDNNDIAQAGPSYYSGQVLRYAA